MSGAMALACVGLLGLGHLGPTAQGENPLVGRWDLTMHAAAGDYPSWFEVTREGDSLRGRFQGQVGHATALAAIRVEGRSFSFFWPNEDDAAAKPTEFRGTIRPDSSLTGSMLAGDGSRTPFTGIPAPTLQRPRPPEWDKPIDLLAYGLDGWSARDPGKNGWSLAAGVLSNTLPSSDLISKQRFTDFKLHVEVNVPKDGNSGIYLRGRHEVQVQDDYGKEPHSRRMGGIYGQVTPTTLPAKPAGEWQTFDITLVGRRVTVVLNGVTIIDNQEIPGITGGALDSNEAANGPIMLQGDHTSVQYRNIQVTPAKGRMIR